MCGMSERDICTASPLASNILLALFYWRYFIGAILLALFGAIWRYFIGAIIMVENSAK